MEHIDTFPPQITPPPKKNWKKNNKYLSGRQVIGSVQNIVKWIHPKWKNIQNISSQKRQFRLFRLSQKRFYKHPVLPIPSNRYPVYSGIARIVRKE